MQYLIPFTLGLLIFGAFMAILLIKEKRANSKPPTHPCRQIHSCQCKSQPHRKSESCQNHQPSPEQCEEP
jgi:hypothetical protein